MIFIATIVVWFLQSFSWKMHLVSDAEQSILASVARLVSPLMNPIGLGDWQIVVSLVSGFIAKESVVSTLEILFAGGIEQVIGAVSAASLLVFSLLYTPCIAAIAAVKRELGARWAVLLVVWQCVIAWICAFAVRFFAQLAGL